MRVVPELGVNTRYVLFDSPFQHAVRAVLLVQFNPQCVLFRNLALTHGACCLTHHLMLDWVSSEALVGMEWVECLPNTVPLLIALPFFNLGKQNELRLDKFGISRLHSTWTFTI